MCACSVLGCLQDNDTYVRRNAAIAIREVVKHSEELASIVNKAGGSAALVEYSNGCAGAARLAAVMALGYIGSYSESLSSAVLAAGGTNCLKSVLLTEPEDHLKAAAVWALGQLGKHDSEHANVLAREDVLRLLQDTLLHEESSDGACTRACALFVCKWGQACAAATIRVLARGLVSCRDTGLPALRATRSCVLFLFCAMFMIFREGDGMIDESFPALHVFFLWQRRVDACFAR